MQYIGGALFHSSSTMLLSSTYPQRVVRQFGRLQPTNVQTVSTSPTLHSMERRKYRRVVNWAERHNTWLYETIVTHLRFNLATALSTDKACTKAYLRWLHANSLMSVKPTTNVAQIEGLPDSDVEVELVDDYDELTRVGTQRERELFQNYVTQQFGRLANDAGDVLQNPPGSVQEVCWNCRRLAFKCNCITTSDVLVDEPLAFGLQAASGSVAKTSVHGNASHTTTNAARNAVAPFLLLGLLRPLELLVRVSFPKAHNSKTTTPHRLRRQRHLVD